MRIETGFAKSGLGPAARRLAQVLANRYVVPAFSRSKPTVARRYSDVISASPIHRLPAAISDISSTRLQLTIDHMLRSSNWISQAQSHQMDSNTRRLRPQTRLIRPSNTLRGSGLPTFRSRASKIVTGVTLLQRRLADHQPYIKSDEDAPIRYIPSKTSAQRIHADEFTIDAVSNRMPEYAQMNPTDLRSTLQKSAGGGERIEAPIIRRLRRHFSFDPSIARVFRGSAPSKAAQALQARAFTIGTDVFFGAGNYQPNSRPGLALLAHEVTHVGQQAKRGIPSVRFFTRLGGDHLEKEAQDAAADVSAKYDNPDNGNQQDSAMKVHDSVTELTLARRSNSLTENTDMSAPNKAADEHSNNSGAESSPDEITDHVYKLIKQEIMNGKLRGLSLGSS